MPDEPARPLSPSEGAGSAPVKVTVCAGSSCHVRGSRTVLGRFAEIVKVEGLGDRVALVGSFCMERCGEGVNWKIDDEEIASATVEEAEATFRGRVVDAARKG